MSYTRAEQETTIIWNEDDKLAYIYTASPVTLRKLDKLCADYPTDYQRTWIEDDRDGRITAAKYVVHSRFIRFGKPASRQQIERGRMMAAMMAERKNLQEQ